MDARKARDQTRKRQANANKQRETTVTMMTREKQK
jgi:hypothetical protein